MGPGDSDIAIMLRRYFNLEVQVFNKLISQGLKNAVINFETILAN
jgi:hypothetical protein